MTTIKTTEQVAKDLERVSAVLEEYAFEDNASEAAGLMNLAAEMLRDAGLLAEAGSEPSEAQVEAAARALLQDHANRTGAYIVPSWENTRYGDRLVYLGKARAALAAAQVTAPAVPAIAVDEGKLAEAIAEELETDDAIAADWSSAKVQATARRLVKLAVLPMLTPPVPEALGGKQ